VASISHLPHVIAFALAEMTSFEAMKHCGNGFRDMTRLAQSDPELWRDIFLTNVQKIDRSIRSFQKELSQLQKLIHSKKEKQLLSHLHKACNKRQRLSFS
jgi:prephenate dehydrogenase